MPNRNSELAELAQMMQLVNGGGQDNSAALQQQGALQWMRMQEEQKQRAMEQGLRQQGLQQQGQYHEGMLRQQLAHDRWQQTHAVNQDTIANTRLGQQLLAEQERNDLNAYQLAISSGTPVAKAISLLPERLQQRLFKQHQADIEQALPGVQSLVANIYNSKTPWKRGTDPNMLAMAAIASAGLRPQDYMDKIDYSGMNPFAGYEEPRPSGVSDRSREENPDLAKQLDEQAKLAQLAEAARQEKVSKYEAEMRRKNLKELLKKPSEVLRWEPM
jgi:hypothetical protein